MAAAWQAPLSESWREVLMCLQNKVALITGGTSGIGEATAQLFTRRGARVVITGRSREHGEAAVSRIPNSATFIQADCGKSEDCRRAVEETLSAFQRLDILVNNAGVFYPHTILDCSETEWDEQLDSKLKGTFLMSKFALPAMITQGRGVIINISSGWGWLAATRPWRIAPPTVA